MKPGSVFWRVLGAVLIVALLSVASHSAARDRELNDSPDFRVRVQAALRLGRAGPSSRADLERGLRDAHPAVRVACAAALGNIGDRAALPALERAMKTEGYATAKAAMKDTVAKLRGASGGDGSSPTGAPSLVGARYVVQLGAMRNVSGVHADDIDSIMRSAARAKVGAIKGAVVIDGADPALVKKAAARRIPVLQVDGNLTKLTQVPGSDGAMVVSARVAMSIRKLPGQTLTGTVSGSASGSHGSRVSQQSLRALQHRVVGGAVESAMGSMGAELAALAR